MVAVGGLETPTIRKSSNNFKNLNFADVKKSREEL